MHDLSWSGRRLHLVLVLIAAATALAILSTAQAAVWLEHGGQIVPWTGLLKARLVDCYCYALFVPLLFALARRFPIGGRHWTESLAVHLGASLMLAVAKEALYVTIGNWFRPGAFELTEILAEDYGSEVFTFWALIAVSHAVLFHRLGAPAPTRASVDEVGETGRLLVRDGGTCHFVAIADIDWIDAQGNYARLNTRHGRFLIRGTMAALQRRLGSAFVRVHRGAMVNRGRIAGIERRPRGTPVVVLDDGTRVATGRAYLGVIRALAR